MPREKRCHCLKKAQLWKHIGLQKGVRHSDQKFSNSWALSSALNNKCTSHYLRKYSIRTYYYFPWSGCLFGGGPIPVNYSMWKKVTQTKRLHHAKTHKKCLQCDVSTFISCFHYNISKSLIWIWKMFHVELNGLYSRFI